MQLATRFSVALQRFALGALVLSLCGCVTATITPEHPSQVPAERLFEMPTARSDSPARITVVRDVGRIGSAVYVHVSIDGKEVAALNPGESFEADLDAGQHLLSAIPTDVFGVEKPVVLDVQLHPKQALLYRIGFQPSGPMVFYRDLPRP